MSRVYEYYEGDAKEIEGARKEDLLQDHWGQYKEPLDVNKALNDCHEKIHRLQRNNELLKAYMVSKIGVPSSVAIGMIKNHLENNGGFPEEF